VKDLSLTRLWGMRLLFALLIVTILFFHLLPLDTLPRPWAGPNWILAFAFAWALRRPEFVPIWALAILFLLTDMLLQRPPGLWAALAVFACESLKLRARSLRDSGFASEWFAVCAMILGIVLAYRFALMITFSPLPSLGLMLFEMIATMLAYPAAVAISYGLMGVRKAGPGDFDTLGGR